MAFRSVQNWKVGNRKIDVAIIVPARNIFQKALDHRRWNHVTDILGDIAGISLKGYTDHLAVLEYRAAGVPRIDCGRDLDSQMKIDPGMRIGLEVDSRNDSLRY